MITKALILAAGVGRRLSTQGNAAPKCLLEFGGQSLLERHLRILRNAGIHEIVVGVGYQADRIQQTISRLGAQDYTRTVYNPHFDRGSVVTLWALAAELAKADGVLLMDADVLFDHRMIARLLDAHSANCFLLDREFEPGDEPIKLCAQQDRLVEFRKTITPDLDYDLIGESVGFFRFGSGLAKRLATATERYFNAGLHQEHYEEAIRDLLLETPDDFGFEDVTGVPWIEIDFTEDVTRAEREIFPQLIPLDE